MIEVNFLRKICRRRETRGAEEQRPLPRYRYRTPALRGAWRESREEAIRDAVKAKQARIDDAGANDVTWIVPGQIEEQDSATAF